MDEQIGDENELIPNNEEAEQTAKEKRTEEEKQELLNRVVSGNIVDIKDRVAFILNSSNEARNSDNELAWSYWETFEPEKLINGMATREAMQQLTKQSSLTRVRAKIQNEYKLFVADAKVRKHRRQLEEGNKQAAIDDKPSGLGLYQVYVDETGKNQEFLSVGSLWMLNYGLSTITKSLEIRKWKVASGYNFEFHFTEAKKNSIDAHKAFVTKFLSTYPEVGFKLIVVNNKGFKDTNQALTDLTFHLLDKGVDHEHSSGRAPLPRMLQVLIDEDEKGSDQLKIQNLKERLRNKVDGLYLGEFETVESTNNIFIQMTDLFTGAINRKLHQSEGGHFKDDLADFILNAVKFDIRSLNIENSDTDRAKVFNLTIEPNSND